MDDLFLPGTDDKDVDAIARLDGLIIVGHDQRFLRKIQQPLFNFAEKASSGYGRIMLCGRESRQPERMRTALAILEIYHRWAVLTEHRFLAVIGDNWVRFDDEPLQRTPRATRALPPSMVEEEPQPSDNDAGPQTEDRP